MKNFNAVRCAAFLMTLLVNADVAEAKMMNDRPMAGHLAKCERCGQTGPTVPEGPVVFRANRAVESAFHPGPGSAEMGAAVRSVRSDSTVPVRDEFVFGSGGWAVGAVFTR